MGGPCGQKMWYCVGARLCVLFSEFLSRKGKMDLNHIIVYYPIHVIMKTKKRKKERKLHMVMVMIPNNVQSSLVSFCLKQERWWCLMC